MKIAKIATLAAFVLAQAAYADILTYDATLLGTGEVPPTGSTGTGEATVIINTILQTMEVEIVFSGLEAPSTASHIHCCTTTPGTGTAGVATTTPSFVGFPLGVTSGSFNNTLDLTASSTYNRHL